MSTTTANGTATPVPTTEQPRVKKGLNAATKNKSRNPNLMHLLLIRHAESSNNVLAEQIQKELGINPYAPDAANSQQNVLAEYDRRRLCDPHLSPLGERQAALLPQHPHLLELGIQELAAAGRVRVVTSPMKRAILTSIPLLKTYNLPRALLVAEVCEKGGSYVSSKTADGQEVNKAHPGLTRAELNALYHETHDASRTHEDGWWRTPCTGAEDAAAFETRLGEAKRFIEDTLIEYAAAPETTPDYMLVVSHADFIDAMLTKLLRLTNHAKYVFYSGNTSISHVEFEVKDPSPEAIRAHQVLRLRCTNSKPARVEAHELPVHHPDHPQQPPPQ